MENEATIPETGTATENENLSAEDRLTALFDMQEASDGSEQADSHVEENEPVTESDETEIETPEEQYFDFDGEQVSLSELRNGYLRQNDFTRKTQALAEQRKHYESNQRDINQLRVEALQGIEALKSQMAMEFRMMDVPTADQWEALLQDDPAEYLRQQHVWQKKQAAVQQMYNAEQAMKAKQAEYEAELHQNALRASSEQFYQKYPDLKDGNKSGEVFSEITQSLLDHSFTPDEIKGVTDFRIIDILYQNLLAQKASKAVPEAVAKIEKKPVLKQNNQSAKVGDDYSRSVAQFNKTKSGADAISALERLFG